MEGLFGDNMEEMAENMEKNLKEKGWMFNAEDDDDDVDSESKEKLEMGVYDYANLEPQLSQEELKQLRDLLK